MSAYANSPAASPADFEVQVEGKVGLGAASLGGMYGDIPEEQAHEVVRQGGQEKFLTTA